MNNITIKQASENNIPVIEEIMLDVVDFLDEIGQPQWERKNVTWQGLSRHFKTDDFYIAYIGGNPVGCMALIDYDPTFWVDIQKGDSLFIHKLAVKRCGAKQGVSKKLIDYAKSQSIKLGINEVRLDTHQFREKVRAIYEREGFVCVDERCLFGKYHTAFYVWKANNEVINHYDTLIIENNDPVHDPLPLQKYMDKWDGADFIEALQLSPEKSVFEIGVGTGRLAIQVCDKCKNFTGIDISPKTIELAKENLCKYPNIFLVCGDYLNFNSDKTFDVIYSSLTFMHIKDKRAAIQKTAQLLNRNGRFILSISIDQTVTLDFGNRKIDVYPDTSDNIASLLIESGLNIEKQFDTEFAMIFVAQKG